MLDNKKIFLFLFFTIFFIGLFLRFYKLSEIPVGFHMDEASKGYSAYSLLKTSKDDNGNYLPLNIDIFGDNSPAGYHYLTIFPASIFGLNEFAVRFPGAIIGSLTIISFYFLSFSIFKSKALGLISSLFLAISPWHINLSRASSESLVSLFFIISGFALVFLSLKTKKKFHILIGTTLLLISFFFYQTPRLFVPLLFFILVIFIFKVWKIKISTDYKKILLYSFLSLSIIVSILFFIVPGGKGRFAQVNIFNYSETQLKLKEQIAGEGLIGTDLFITRLFHNKVIGYSQAYISNYLSYFSWNFLFTGGLPPIYQIPNMGVLYLIHLPFILIGLFALLINKNLLYKIPLIWLIISPIPAATAVDTNNLQRAIVVFAILELISAFGIFYLIKVIVKKRQKIWISTICIFFMVSFLYFYHQYYFLSQVFQPWYRNNGFSKMMNIVNENYRDFDKIISTKSGGGYPLFQFYSKYDPAMYQKEGSPKDKNYKGFGKFIFSPDNCPFITQDPLLPREGKLIFVEDGSCAEAKQLEKVTFTYVLREDNTKAFRIVFLEDF